MEGLWARALRRRHGEHAGGTAEGVRDCARARGCRCGELSRERHRAADGGRGGAGAGQSQPGEPGALAELGAAVSDGAHTLLGGDEA